jgi:hypothetical protein
VSSISDQKGKTHRLPRSVEREHAAVGVDVDDRIAGLDAVCYYESSNQGNSSSGRPTRSILYPVILSVIEGF